jgi:hypothetical protein
VREFQENTLAQAVLDIIVQESLKVPGQGFGERRSKVSWSTILPER